VLRVHDRLVVVGGSEEHEHPAGAR
jgi:hypothetical protein